MKSRGVPLNLQKVIHFLQRVQQQPSLGRGGAEVCAPPQHGDQRRAALGAAQGGSGLCQGGERRTICGFKLDCLVVVCVQAEAHGFDGPTRV